MKWHRLNRGAVLADIGGWYLLKRYQLFLIPIWDVYRDYTIGNERRFERFAGGFWTRAGAQQWATIEQLGSLK